MVMVGRSVHLTTLFSVVRHVTDCAIQLLGRIQVERKNRMFLVFNVFADVCKHRFSHKYYIEGFKYKGIRI